MRYLKATAQDRSGNGKADTVIVHFYESQTDEPDALRYEALAVDMDGDSVIDVQCAGDINRDGQSTLADQQLLKAFASAFLKIGWCNRANSSQRALTLYVDHYDKQGKPNAIKLQLHDVQDGTRKESLRCSAAAYDADGNGVLETFTKSDIDGNGSADNVDKEWIRALASTFLAMKWYETHATATDVACTR